MRKSYAIVALGLIVVSSWPVLADDSAKTTKTSAPAAADDSSTKGSNGTAVGPAKWKHKGRGRSSKATGHGKRQVMALTDLTDKQKSQIQAIYASKKDQFVDLRKQMNALEADEWQQIQGILTPAQIQLLDGKKASASASGSDAASAKNPADSPASAK